MIRPEISAFVVTSVTLNFFGRGMIWKREGTMKTETSNSAAIAGHHAGRKSNQGPDWEAIFEHPETGIFSLLSRAKSPRAMEKIVDLIVSTLFSRADDADRRDTFRNLLDDMIQVGGDGDKQPSFELVRHRMVQLMRGIKEDRIMRANLVRLDDDESSLDIRRGAERRRDEPEIVATPSPANDAEASVWRAISDRDDEHTLFASLDDLPPPKKLDEALADVLVASIEERFLVLQKKPQSQPIPGRRPFLLAPGFVARYTTIVREVLVPLMVPRCRSVTNAATDHPRETWRQVLAAASMDRDHRLTLWEAWQSAWLESTTRAVPPPKPGNATFRSVDRKVRTGDDEPEMSLEAWETQVGFIKLQNKRANAVWSRFTAFADDYHAPLDQDNRLLIELFGRSASGIAEQISALLQIAAHRENPTQLFETYQRGKSVDASLLAACYQYPDVFVTGERPMLNVLLRNYGRRRRLETLPLVSRYLGDRIR